MRKVWDWLLEKKEYGIVLAILLVSLSCMIYYGGKKEGYHIDELYSYGLSNSEYLPFLHMGECGYDVKDWMNEYGAGESVGDLCRNLINDIGILAEHDFDVYTTPIYQAYLVAQANSADTKTTTWVSGKEYYDYLAVSDTNAFNYASVYYNQRGDVHPPFFYMCLHTISSVFQGTFSKWYGLVLNFVALLGTLATLYEMCRKYLGGKYVGYAVLLSYAFSIGLLSNAMFIRMYSLFTLWVVLTCYWHLRMVYEGYTPKKGDIIRLATVVFLGYYTHYYYVLYIIFMAVVTCVIMLWKRKWKSLLKYIVTLSCTAGIGLVIWPFAIRHVFDGYRGRESLGVLTSGEYHFIKVKVMAMYAARQLIGEKWIIPLVIIILAIVVAIWKGRKSWPWEKIAIVLLPTVGYFFIVPQIAPFLTERYVMCVFPLVVVLLVGSVYLCMKSMVSQKIAIGTVLTVGVLLLLVNNVFWNTPANLYEGGQETLLVPENTQAVYVLPDGSWNESTLECVALSKCERVGVVYVSNLEVLREPSVENECDNLLLYIQKDMDVESVKQQVLDVLEVENAELLDEYVTSAAVRYLLRVKNVI